jgi:hypothetical protein
MKKHLIAVLLLFVVVLTQIAPSSLASLESFWQQTEQTDQVQPATQFASASQLFARQVNDEMVDGKGRVIRLLADDNEGSRHQRFLVAIENRQTLLLAHNIDLAPRIDALKVGDEVGFRGAYVYNAKGGVVHWTHLDPRNRHEPGWIKHNGVTYQ